MNKILEAKEGNLFQITWPNGFNESPDIKVNAFNFDLDYAQGFDIEVIKAFHNYIGEYIEKLESIDRTKIQMPYSFSDHSFTPASYSARYVREQESE